MCNIYTERKEDLSLYYWVEELFEDTPFISIVDGFPTEDLKIPTIAVDNFNIEPGLFQLGSNTRIKYRVWHIEIFAKNKSQRDEIGYKILNALETTPIAVYDYDEGFPPEVTPTEIGRLEIDDVSYRPMSVMPELMDKLYWRANIHLAAHNNVV